MSEPDPLSVTRASPTPSGPFAAPQGGPPADPALDKDPLVKPIPVTPAGRVLGGVRLVRKIGQGGMGAVYAGYHVALDLPVAVKVLPADLVARDKSYVDRFLREARLSAKISHQNLVNTKNVGHEHGLFFLVMDLIEGSSAQKILDARGPLPEGDALRIVHEASLGLAEAHASSVVHRDVKPDNIIVRSRDGQAKLADLGLAHTIRAAREDGRVEEPLTVSGTPLGTPLFMAPEQTEDAHGVGPAADVWSMGATLYALLTGKPPFSGANILLLLEAIRRQPTPELGKLRPDVTPATRVLVARCLEKDPKKRPRDAGELAEELAAIRGTLSGKMRVAVTAAEASKVPFTPGRAQLQSTFVETPRPSSAPPSPPAPAPARTGSVALVTGAVLGFVGVAGLVAALLIVFAHEQHGSEPPVPLVSPAASPASPSPEPRATPSASPVATASPSPVASASPSPAATPAGPTPAPSPLASPSPVEPPLPPPDPSPRPLPSATPPPAPVGFVEDLPVELRTWDGHGWRRNAPGHRHRKNAAGDGTCGHFYDPDRKCWRFDQGEPREYPYEIDDEKRRDPGSGLYDYDGKTWFLMGHMHSPTCQHVFRQDRWVLRTPEK